MRLAFAILADAAVFTPDGKLQVQGGDLDTVYSTVFPAVQPTMSLAVKLNADSGDISQGFILRLEATTPQDAPWFPAFAVPFTANPNPLTGGQPVKVAFVLNLPMLVFPIAGTYKIRLSVKRDQPGERFRLLIELPVYAMLMPASEATAETGLQAPTGEAVR